MQEKRETLPISVLQDIGLSISTLCIDSGTVDAEYSDVLEQFVYAVIGNMKMLNITSMRCEEFEAVIATTVLMELVTNDLNTKIPPQVLAEFTGTWANALFTNLFGETLEEVWDNIEKLLRRDDFVGVTPEGWHEVCDKCWDKMDSGECTCECEECEYF